MLLVENQCVKALVFKSFMDRGVTAAFSTRIGGVSDGYHHSMNLSFNLGDEEENVRRNFDLFAQALGRRADDFIHSNQVHEDNIMEVFSKDKGLNMSLEPDSVGVDGFITTDDSVVLVNRFADCVPVYFYHELSSTIAICHSGWRGTQKNIAGKMIEGFVKKSLNPEDIIVGIGPSICKKCFEVGKEVVDMFAIYPYISDYYTYNPDKDRYYIDLRGIIREQLLERGVKAANIEVSTECTYEDKKLFFSHRRDGKLRGSQVGVIFINS